MPRQAKKSLLQGLLARFSGRKEPPAATGPHTRFNSLRRRQPASEHQEERTT